MNPLITTLTAALLTFSLSVAATPGVELIHLYNQAAQGDEDKVDQAYDQFNELIRSEGETPLTLVYLGASETLKGRDTWLPWKAMGYVESGLSHIDRGLNLLNEQSLPLAQQPRIQGLPENYLARATAAVTYTQLPGMFNQFDKGYDLYLVLLEEPQFQQQPFAAVSWIYHYAIAAALKADDDYQARLWLKRMQQQAPQHPDTLAAHALLAKG
ncbi:hypothetical protein [Ferrimonas kyonanensis]|uniref:hypothetical protein n=1 Tax=Ferrimonas kyonanensis TaxID=364763 RepID=UPI0004110B3E|nr:hypothetical protein [Ferrimonas kyonanensis]